MNQDWFKDVLMITKMITKDDDKGDDKKLKGQSKNEFKIFKIESRTIQDSRGKLISRIKNQDSRDQDSRIKRRLNQDKYEKVFFKNWVAHGFFTKHVYRRVFTLW